MADQGRTPTGEPTSRYQIHDLLGFGGRGQVYRARDAVLDRWVALKILRSDDDTQERLMREARAQARVDHPNVCRVFEAGDLGGKAFIAMQLVYGVPIDRATEDLDFEGKVDLMRRVADAVQAAHSQGLVHRDLKPGNVLVERHPDRLEPFVVDFGLAIEPDTPGLTATGTVIGTPGYMAPEQVTGDRSRIDRRTDVYALGAILYQLLAGQAPYHGATPVQVLVDTAHKDPVPLRQLNPEVPRELVLVVNKCLEREPERRYGSARLLAEDLERFLAGEPLHARPVSIVYRWKHRVRRSPVASAIVALAAVAALSMGAVAVHSRATAAEQATIAQRFGREVERIDVAMRLAHLGALHDLRPQKEALRRRLDRLEAELPGLGPVARGPGDFALGSGYMSLGDSRRASEHLERAWDAGYRPPEVAHALALALGELYQQGIVDAERLDDEIAREARRQALERRYRDRALALLRQAGRVDEQPAPLLEARLAHFEGRVEDAAELASRAVEVAPWLYEGHLLRGDALVASAAAIRGESGAGTVRERLEEADEAYRLAAREARSDPRAHDGRCSVGVQAVGILYFGSGGDLQPRLEVAAEACERSLVADPDRGRPHALLSGLWLMASRDLSRRGEDPMAVVDRAVDEGRAAVRREPEVAEHHRSLGSALTFRAEFERDRGIDSAATLEEALGQLEQAIALDPRDAASYNSVGLAQWEMILWARAHGEDQRSHLDAATAAFRRATELLPGYARAFSNLGSIFNLRIEYETARGLDPEASFEAAAVAFRRAIEADPDYVYAYNNLGNVYRHRGEHALERGQDPTSSIRQAERFFREAAERNPGWSYPHFNTGLALHDLARWRTDTGADPEDAIEAAAAAFRRGFAIKPDLPPALLSAAMVDLLRAGHRLEKGDDPRSALEAARSLVAEARRLDPESGFGLELHGAVELLDARSRPGRADAYFHAAEALLERSVQKVPDSVTAHLRLAELAWHRAAWESSRGLSPAATLGRGLAAAERALEINPRAADAEALRGELHLLLAAVEDRDSHAASALEALERALELKPSLTRRHGPSLERAREHALESAGRGASTA